MDLSQFQPREAQGPPGGFGALLSSVLAGTTSTTTSSTTTSSTSSSSTSSTTSSSSITSSTTTTATSQSSDATSSTTEVSSTSAASLASSISSTATSSDSTTSTDAGAATTATTSTSSGLSTTGSSAFSTSIAGASYTQTTSVSSSGSFGPDPAAVTSATEINNTSNAQHSGISPGAIAAAVIVPVIFALLALFLTFTCLRRRSRNSHGRTGSNLGFLGVAQEKSDWRGGAGPTGTGNTERDVTMAAPVMTSERNRAYLTGLDTPYDNSSRGESQEYYNSDGQTLGGSSTEIPPPYIASATALGSTSQPQSIPRSPPFGPLAAPLVSRYSTVWDDHHQVVPPEDNSARRSPFADPESPNTPVVAPFMTNGLLSSNTNERPGTNHSSHSITSTLYSDAASIHDAHTAHVSTAPAARMSTATLVESVTARPLSVQPRHVDTGLSQLEGPFRDPSSPVSSMHSPASSLSAPEPRRTSSFESGVSDLPPESRG